jgi:hypothetical protein
VLRTYRVVAEITIGGESSVDGRRVPPSECWVYDYFNALVHARRGAAVSWPEEPFLASFAKVVRVTKTGESE